MKLKEQFKMLVFLLTLPLAFAACDNDDNASGEGLPIVVEKVYSYSTREFKVEV